ncbi:hypothetical protein Tsubulata_046535 [Turnera subulata]|uniref:Uncharacterized protein n=1 Tax=Turnera subulata TaxID=218843 RepID=A0A9Q0JCN7_9ROSI|nr:hypothetical protein Tsubulata_046535 [Turnera subulata]
MYLSVDRVEPSRQPSEATNGQSTRRWCAGKRRRSIGKAKPHHIARSVPKDLVYLEANWIGRRSRLMPVKETTGKKRIKSGKEQHLISVTTVKNASPQLSRQEVEADPVGEASKIFSQQGHSIFNFKIDIHLR